MPYWHQRSIMMGDDGGMLETTKQASTQETVTQQGRMIFLTDKRGIQLGDALRDRREG